MTGHDDMVAYAHNVSLRFTSVILAKHGGRTLFLQWLRAPGALAIRSIWLGPMDDLAFGPMAFPTLLVFLYISALVGTRCSTIFCFLLNARIDVACCTLYRCLHTPSPYHDSMTNITIGRRASGVYGFSDTGSS
ncbi:hypothetical protein HBI56_025850 [Parastagonospora nodorum]|uniref:Uncharacterized protein n=1 Tax=Phaeosphaeria nodorum (strain SN15 / ATCC MYA-4574 / FGSC 10173) TaxID=321614 RepID=A0A7U2HYB5_PHANO|nr:hypothetical protein HBH56_013510 [Parastagonospora nodorum]QRC94874.1 hypothetical protein JI435_026180 [Parastagonospora nodorum SN15]KAH3937470.1 hypothetical protein HBH54_020940 [Parastagonospora nodorum]KAH3953777.1 hypothetical protein HBH53_033340 [Parastagonospora nodorum]KAH3969404.1 hypothetical protein HBH51_125500 [Parastagonospora nodorum]